MAFLFVMEPQYSFIIPVYNRPEEVRELLHSLVSLEPAASFEVVLVEDGSTETSEDVVAEYGDQLAIQYFYKPNSGPGDSRNYGMRKARAPYYIILDSDCLLPPAYLRAVTESQEKEFLHCFGGPDAAHHDFTKIQKAINYAMTSFLTTGGVRGGKGAGSSYEPRSFNMGLSREAFQASGGFGSIHPGEDPDLSIRLRKLGYQTGLIREAFVYHKRRVDFRKFLKQVYKFGMVRPILNRWHPETQRLAYWFPFLFSSGLVIATGLALVTDSILGQLPLYAYLVYFLLLFLHAALLNKSLPVAVLSPFAAFLQFIGYGFGFIKSTILVTFSKKQPEELFPELFFKNQKA